MIPSLPLDQVVRLWFSRQGFTTPRGFVPLTRQALVDHLERTGALQLDSVNVLDRAHYLTLWSRFGPYDRSEVDAWVYGEGAGYEYWGHEASILAMSHLPLGRRRMRRFPPRSWQGKAWWVHYQTSPASKRRVLRRLREEGPLESVDFERHPGEKITLRGVMPFIKEDKRSLKLLWHSGRVAVRARRHFRCVYDIADRVLPQGEPATAAEYEDSWLLTGLAGNGVASERHLTNYLTAPGPNREVRDRIIARNLRSGRIVEVRVEGRRDRFYALPEHLEGLADLPEPQGTTLVCPFDSLLWQRKRAEEFLDFRYRIEIYIPPAKRQYGYYVLPILHDGRLVGRLDPKVHRDKDRLEIRQVQLEDSFKPDTRFKRELGEVLDSLRTFVGADEFTLPRKWARLLD
jgi:uncharacterized protein